MLKNQRQPEFNIFEKVSFLAIGFIFVFQLMFPQYAYAYEATEQFRLPESGLRKPIKIKRYIVTAYSSTPDQTDSTPFITANGSYVKDGIVATNMYPFGTRIKFPELYGDKIFRVEDRMHQRFSNRFDIWMETRAEAISFGSQYLLVEIY